MRLSIAFTTVMSVLALSSATTNLTRMEKEKKAKSPFLNKTFFRKLKISAMTKAYSKSNLLGRSLASIGRKLYDQDDQAMYDSTIGNAMKWLAEEVFDDGPESPAVFCSGHMYRAATLEECTDANDALLTLISRVAYSPWVLEDMAAFMESHLPELEDIKEIIQDNNVVDILAELIDSQKYDIPFLYDEIMFLLNDIGFVGQNSDSSEVYEFKEFIEFLADLFIPKFFLMPFAEENVDLYNDMIEPIHDGICYMFSMKRVKLDFAGNCDQDEISKVMKNVPFCVDENLDYAPGDVWHNIEGECSLKISFAQEDESEVGPGVVYDDEDPKAVISFKNNQGNTLNKTCNWLRKKKWGFRQKLCSASNISITCPSSCCVIQEDPKSSFLKKWTNENRQTKKCGWLAVQSNKKKLCNITKRPADHANGDPSPAYVACPETCGVCPVDLPIM